MDETNRSDAMGPVPRPRRDASITLVPAPAATALQRDAVWIPMAPGQSIRPIHFMPGHAGYVAQLRLEPGTAIPPHRHTGEVHAFNVQGSRMLHTGERIGPGDYVYEPAGNVDTWEAVGDEPVVVLIVVRGAVEYLGADGEVDVRYDAALLETAERGLRQAIASGGEDPGAASNVAGTDPSAGFGEVR